MTALLQSSSPRLRETAVQLLLRRYNWLDRLLHHCAQLEVVSPRGDIAALATDIQRALRETARLGQTASLLQMHHSELRRLLERLILMLFIEYPEAVRFVPLCLFVCFSAFQYILTSCVSVSERY